MSIITRVLQAGAIAAFAAGSLAAQVVSGTVVLRDSSAAVGVIVQANDPRGKAAGTALTNSRGEFRLPLPGDGRFDLKVLRIGYRPTPGPSVTVSGGRAGPVRIVLTGEAVILSGINVRDRETCRISADSGMMVARLWQEAQKAMQTVQLSAEGEPLVAEWIEYDRTLDSTARLVRAQRVRTTREATTHAFKSRHSAEWLDSAGYVVTDGGGTTFFAPDADVLLSERFASAHCFHLQEPPREAPTLIGVGFTPARDRRDASDIEGIVWLDRRAGELQLLEFKYTNQPDAAMPAEPGGRVEFLRVTGGRWLVSRWNVRMPQLGPRSRTTSDGLGRVVMSATTSIVRAVQVSGGEVTRVMQRDTVLYTALGPAIKIDVVSRDSGFSGAGARLSLEGTNYSATADANGRIRFTPVLGGRYRAELRAPMLDSLGVPPVSLEVEARIDDRVDTVLLPTPRDVLLRVCPKDSVADGEGLLRGTLATEHGTALAHAAVVVTWQRNFDIIDGARRDLLRYTEKTLGTLSDGKGTWRICGVPVNTPLTVRVLSDSGADVRRTRLAGVFGAVDLVARPTVIGEKSNRELLIPTGASPSMAAALVEFSVLDLRGAPLANAQLEARPKRGPTRTVVTGTSGRALLPDVEPGVVEIQVRRVGFKPGRLAATIEPGRNTVPIVMTEVDAPVLDTVRVVGGVLRSGRGRFDEFETRRVLRAATATITSDDIKQRNPVSLWQMLTGIASIKVVDTMSVTVESARSNLSRFGALVPCYLSVVVNGIPQRPKPGAGAFDLRDLPPPADIYGIEVFAGGASIPVQYGGTGDGKLCGLIAIWTR
ncbi:MAG TPA: carboxypeptidase regulatory-like domain-containing protein [Gemmatimonadaceae bacterium]|jgi:hypothetical protein|nr:carboxypeptidase regulatory-like domain-containing protein [Gemmatimonadaceae bacterium]